MRRISIRAASLPATSQWIVACICGVGLCYAVVGSGTPALRHDWFVFDNRHDFFASAWNTFGGWTSDGIGAPRPYPSDYLFIAFDSLCVFFVGTHVDLALIATSIGFAAARAGWLMAALT